MCEKHALTEAAGELELGLNCSTDIRCVSAISSVNNGAPPPALFAGVMEANVLALQSLLLMKVLWLDSGVVESRL